MDGEHGQGGGESARPPAAFQPATRHGHGFPLTSPHSATILSLEFVELWSASVHLRGFTTLLSASLAGVFCASGIVPFCRGLRE